MWIDTAATFLGPPAGPLERTRLCWLMPGDRFVFSPTAQYRGDPNGLLELRGFHELVTTSNRDLLSTEDSLKISAKNTEEAPTVCQPPCFCVVFDSMKGQAFSVDTMLCLLPVVVVQLAVLSPMESENGDFYVPERFKHLETRRQKAERLATQQAKLDKMLEGKSLRWI